MSNTDLAKDYLLKVKIQNNKIISLMKNKGLKSAAELSRAIDPKKNYQGEIGELLAMTVSPFFTRKKKGRKDQLWRDVVLKMAEFFKVEPHEMFNEQQLYDTLETNKAEKEIDLNTLQALLPQQREVNAELLIEYDEKQKIIEQALQTLTPREKDIIQQRFGFNGEVQTLKELGIQYGTQQERMRQVQEKALRKLRRPSLNFLRELEDNEDYKYISHSNPYALTMDEKNKILEIIITFPFKHFYINDWPFRQKLVKKINCLEIPFDKAMNYIEELKAKGLIGKCHLCLNEKVKKYTIKAAATICEGCDREDYEKPIVNKEKK